MTHNRFSRLMPSVPRHISVFIAGFMWFWVGIMLLSFVYIWMHRRGIAHPLLFPAIGAFLALFIHQFGFTKIVNKNIQRIHNLPERHPLWAFMSRRSYVLVAVMVTMGSILRHSPLPKSYLAVPYTSMGLALLLSSFRYWKYFFEIW